MTGWWLVSYAALWVLVLVIALLQVGMLRQIGLLQRHLGQRGVPDQDDVPTIEHDGPPIGSHLPAFTAESVNGFGRVTSTSLQGAGRKLLVFMSPGCRGCQDVTEPLNDLALDQARRTNVMVVMRRDEEGCRAFLDLFPLQMPVISDGTVDLTRQFGVRRSPFALLYDDEGILVRKGAIPSAEHVEAVLGSRSVSGTVMEHIFPPSPISVATPSAN